MSEPVVEPAGQEPAEQTAPKTFTQDQVNALLADQKRTVQSRFADYNDLKTKAAEFDKARESAKTDLERAVDTARREGHESAMTAANQRLVRAEARAQAAAARFRDPSDAVAFLGDLSTVRVSPTGDVDTASLQAALTELATQKPYLLAEQAPTRPTGDAGQGPREGTPSGMGVMNDIIRSAAGRR